MLFIKKLFETTFYLFFESHLGIYFTFAFIQKYTLVSVDSFKNIFLHRSSSNI